jgi:vitamin B12 transporter
MHLPKSAVLAAIALAAAANGAAQVPQDTFRLAPVVVTATRLPTPLAEAPGSITVLYGEEMRQRGTRMVVDALRLVPGVAVAQSAGPGALTSVFMRGGESDYVQVLVDGIQVNDPGGAFNWAHLRAEDVDRIEIVRGPASVLYGSDAVSGVVQIFTRAGGAPRVDVSASTRRGDKHDAGGAFTTHAFDATLAGSAAPASIRDGTLRYGVTASRLSSNGLYAFNSDYDNTTVSGRLQLMAPRGDFALTARAADNEYHYPTTGSGVVVNPNQFATGRSLGLGADAGVRLNRAVELRLLATSWANDTRTEDPPNESGGNSFWSTNDQQRRKLDARTNWSPLAGRGNGLVITAGVEREWQSAVTELESISEWGDYVDATDEERQNTGWYVQLHTTPVPGVAATLGGRVDDNAAFGTFRTGRAALSWNPVAAARLHVAAGTAFKEPTFFENFATGFTRGNPDLRPEETRSWEAGAEYTGTAGFGLSATFFDQRFRNLIQYTFMTATPTAPNYENVGGARAHGAELGVRALAGPVAATGSYTLTTTRVTDAGFGADVAFQQDLRLLRRPEHQAALGLAVAASPVLRGTADLRYVGARDDLDFTDPAEWSGIRTVLPAYTTLDLGAEYSLLRRGSTRNAALNFRVRNILDADYQEIFNFPSPGRVFEFGVRAGLGL